MLLSCIAAAVQLYWSPSLILGCIAGDVLCRFRNIMVPLYILLFFTDKTTFLLLDKPWSQVSSLLFPPVLAFNFYRA